MRIKLKRGKQKELILKAKGTKTWKALSNKLGVNEQYLSNELRHEKILLSEKMYNSLCKLTNKNFESRIEMKLEDNWGRIKGGINSKGSTKNLSKINFNHELAEFVGIVLGDGHVCLHKKGKKIGVYCIRICGDLNKDKDYHESYIKKKYNVIFNLKGKEILRTKNNERFLDFYSRELVKLFSDMGIKSGNKIINQSTIPSWVWEDNNLLRACLRGLIDTDGSIFRMSKRDSTLLRINFTNHNKTLLNDTRKAFIRLGFNPSKIIGNRQFHLSRQREIKKYLKEIGFSNNKHKERLKTFNKSLVF